MANTKFKITTTEYSNFVSFLIWSVGKTDYTRTYDNASVTVNWGDNNTTSDSNIPKKSASDFKEFNHTYSVPGTYEIEINVISGYIGFASAPILLTDKHLLEVYIGDNFKELPAQAFAQAPDLQSVTITSCSNMGTKAFYQCPNLTNVTLADGVDTGSSAFEGCTSITGVQITGTVILENKLFCGCTALETVTASNEPGSSNIYTIYIRSDTFENCTNLTQFTATSNYTLHFTSSYGQSGGTFKNCTKLKSVTGGYIKPEGASAFEGCTELTSVPTITGNVGANAFKDCTKLTIDTIKYVANIGAYAFAGCTITDLEIPFNRTVGSYAFSGCNIIDTVDLSGASEIGDHAFVNCNISGSINLQNCESIGDYAFNGCTITDITLAPNLTEFNSSAFDSTPFDSITLYAKTPPTISDTSSISATTIYVPQDAFDVYTESDWNDIGTITLLPDPVAPSGITPSVFIFTTTENNERVYIGGIEAAWVYDEETGDWEYMYDKNSVFVDWGDGIVDIDYKSYWGEHYFVAPGDHVVKLYVTAGAFGYGDGDYSVTTPNISSISLGNGIVHINGNAFYHSEGERPKIDFTIGSDVTELHSNAFYTAAVDTLVIPNNVTTLECGYYEEHGGYGPFSGITADVIKINGTKDILNGAFSDVSANKIILNADTYPVFEDHWAEFNSEWVTEHGPVTVVCSMAMQDVVAATSVDPTTYTIEIGCERDIQTTTPSEFWLNISSKNASVDISLSFASVLSSSANIIIDWNDNSENTEATLSPQSSTFTHHYNPTRGITYKIKVYVITNYAKLYNNGTCAVSITYDRYIAGITKIVFGDGVYEIGEHAFDGFRIPRTGPSQGYGFLQIILNDVYKIGKYAFYDIEMYTPNSSPYDDSTKNYGNIIINSNIELIDDYAFGNIQQNGVNISGICGNIGNYAFSNSILGALTFGNLSGSIGNYAFADSTIASKITIPSDVTNIGFGIFKNTTMYKAPSQYILEAKYDIIINANINIIPNDAFNGASADEIIINSNITAIGQNSFTNANATINFNIDTPPMFNADWATFDTVFGKISAPNELYAPVIAATNTDPNTYVVYVERDISDINPTIMTGVMPVATHLVITSPDDNYAQIKIDWDDGSDIEEVQLVHPVSSGTSKVIPHTYSESKEYSIKIYATVGTAVIGGSKNGTYACPATVTSIVVGDYFSGITDTPFGNFADNNRERSFVFNNNIPITLGNRALGSIRYINSLTIDDSIIVSDDTAFIASDIRNVIIDDTVESLSLKEFNGLTINNVTIGKNVKYIDQSFYSVVIPNGTTATMEFKSPTVPTFTTENYWYYTNSKNVKLNIFVPMESYDAYATAIENSLSGSTKSPYDLYGKRDIDTMTPNVFTVDVPSSSENVNVTIEPTIAGYTCVMIDWGDGTDIEKHEITTKTETELTHTFEAVQKSPTRGGSVSDDNDDAYSIKLYATSGDIILTGVSSNITSIATGDGLNAIADNACESNSNLASVTVLNVDNIGDNAFSGCTALTSVDIDVISIGDNAFSGCTTLASVTLGKNVTSIGDGAFEDCTSLTRVSIPQTVTTMGDNVFAGCTALTAVSIPDNSTVIHVGEFANCTGLTKLELPATITSIEDNAFASDTFDKMIVHAIVPPELTENSFADATVDVIYVPTESIDAYKASAWNDVGTIKSIEYLDPDKYDPESIEDTSGDAEPEQALSGEAIKDIIKAYGKNLKYIKTENNTIAVNDPRKDMLNISSDDLVIRRFHGYDFIECKSFDPFFRKVYYSLIRVNDIRTFVIAENARDTIDAFRC